MTEPGNARTTTLDSPKTGWRSTVLWRAVAVALLALPVFAAIAINAIIFLIVPVCIALLGWFSRLIAWRPLVRVAVVGFVLWPAIATALFTDAPPASFLWFFGFSALCFVVFIAGTLFNSQPLRVSTAKRASALWEIARSMGPEDLTRPPRGMQLIAATTAQDTDAGTEYTVTWADFAKLRLVDRSDAIIVLPVAAAIVLALGFGVGSSRQSIADVLIVTGSVLGVLFVGQGIYQRYHQRARYSVRSVVFQPDGSIAINNPPSSDANRESDGPSLLVDNGLKRLVSIEYGRTSDWYDLRPEYVHGPTVWYDVFMLFDADYRIPVSRAAGSREHAHQIAGQLNALRARLMSTQPRRPRPGRIID